MLSTAPDTILSFPQRRQFPTRDAFVAASMKSFDNLVKQYEQLPTDQKQPAWTSENVGTKVFNVALPKAIVTMSPTSIDAALNSLMLQMMDVNKTITRMCQFFDADYWFLYVEAE